MFVLEKIIADINKNRSKKPTHIELKFSKEKSIISKIENKKSNAEILKEIEKQRELLRLENIEIAKRRDALTKQEIYCEETTKRYERYMNDYENRVNEMGMEEK